MGLIEQINNDIQRITSNSNEFGVNIELIAPNGQRANIVGIHPKVHLGVDTEGNIVNSRQARITFSERTLVGVNVNYPLRNANGDVDLKKHLVNVADSTGNIKNYRVQSWMPDETIGLILVQLESYGTN